MSDTPICPKCSCDYTYQDRDFYVCPECSYEWNPETLEVEKEIGPVFKDAGGNILTNGDTVSLIKDLPIKGSNSKIKAGTKVKNIRLVEGDHNIDCKIDGFGAMMLKSEFVRKV